MAHIQALDAVFETARIAADSLWDAAGYIGEDAGFEVTVRDEDLLDITFSNGCGSASALISLAEIAEAEQDVQEQVVKACRAIQAAARVASPW